MNGQIEVIADVTPRIVGQLPASIRYASFDLNDRGRLAWYSPGDGLLDFKLFSDVAGNHTLVAETGQPAPGMPDGAVFHQFLSPPALNNYGQIAFIASVTGLDSVDQMRGIWVHHPTRGLSLVAREGQSILLTDSPTQGAWLLEEIDLPVDPSSRPALNNLGQLAFYGSLKSQDGRIVEGVFLAGAPIPEPLSLAHALAGWLLLATYHYSTRRIRFSGS